ncbi:hypothetical protein GA0115252_18321, partial [Streptomyces sp. DfronAA-171]
DGSPRAEEDAAHADDPSRVLAPAKHL